jgi:hypothetical protein
MFRGLLQVAFVAAMVLLARSVRADEVIVVTGEAGEAAYEEVFEHASQLWRDAAARGGARCVEIGRKPVGAKSDKALLTDALAAAAAEKSERLWVVLIGHGTFDGHEAKFNLRGEDISDAELAQALKPMSRPVAIMVCASSSGPFLSKLSGPNRVVITATRSGSEIQYSRFGQYLAEAIADPSADLDKDGQTSLLEAFLTASHRTQEFYKREGRLMTEHALLDDNGDGKGTPADFFEGVRPVKAPRTEAQVDGARANQWNLVMSAEEQAMLPELRQKRDTLEMRVESLRAKKTTMEEGEYYKQLDGVLVELAQLYAQAGAATQKGK